MNLNKYQNSIIAKYFSDMSKIVFASAVLGYLIPSDIIEITLTVFVIGTIISALSFVFSVVMAGK